MEQLTVEEMQRRLALSRSFFNKAQNVNLAAKHGSFVWMAMTFVNYICFLSGTGWSHAISNAGWVIGLIVWIMIGYSQYLYRRSLKVLDTGE